MGTSRFARSVGLATFLGTALVGGAALDAALPEEAEAYYDESYFYTSLSSYGSWVNNAQFGWVWYPYHRDAYWRPYTVGHWVWTDYGEWLWVSDEPYGWATYHYGSWFLDPFYGWVWLPGNVWAPAWVSWRDGGDYIGWAPLSPWGYWDSGRHCYRDRDRYYGGYHNGYYDNGYNDGGWHDGNGDNGGWNDGDGDNGGWNGGNGGRGGSYDRNRDGDRNTNEAGIQADYTRDRRYHDNQDTWNFARKRDFASTRVDKVVIDRHHVPEVLRKSRDLPPPTVQEEREGRGTTRAIDKSTIERAAGRPIRPVKVEDSDSPAVAGKRESGSDRVRVYRPKVSERKPDSPTPDKLGIAKATDRGTRQQPARGGRPATTEPSGVDRSGQNPHARGDGSTKQPPSTGRERRDAENPRDATRPATGKSPERAQPRDSGADRPRSGKPDVGAYERPARKDEVGGYERPPRASDHGGYVRPDGDGGRGASKQQPARTNEASGFERPSSKPTHGQQPSRSQQPSYGQQPSRSPQPSHGQQPSRSQQPSYGQQPSRSPQPSHSQQPSRSPQPSYGHQPSHGGSSAPPAPAPAPMPQRAPSSYAPSGGNPGGGHGSSYGSGVSPQGHGSSAPQPMSSPQGGGHGGGHSSGGGGGGHGGSPGGGPGRF